MTTTEARLLPWYETDYTSVECGCPDHAGRDLRLWNGLKALDALTTSADATHNAAVGAARMPFAFTANAGVVFADRVPPHRSEVSA